MVTFCCILGVCGLLLRSCKYDGVLCRTDTHAIEICCCRERYRTVVAEGGLLVVRSRVSVCAFDSVE